MEESIKTQYSVRNNPDLMTPSELIEAVIRAAEKAARMDASPSHNSSDKSFINADDFIQALKDELT